MTMEMCIVPQMEHEFEWIVAAFGQQIWQCKLCGLYENEYEEGSV